MLITWWRGSQRHYRFSYHACSPLISSTMSIWTLRLARVRVLYLFLSSHSDTSQLIRTVWARQRHCLHSTPHTHTPHHSTPHTIVPHTHYSTQTIAHHMPHNIAHRVIERCSHVVLCSVVWWEEVRFGPVKHPAQLNSTAQHNTVQYVTVQYVTVQRRT